jgi:acyl-CoA thioester hydrolase
MSLKNKKTHINKIKVRYSEVDCQRIVYNSHYLTYFDISLSEMLEDCFNQDEYIKNTNNDFHTVGVQMNFKSPARLNDQLEVYTGVEKLGNSSMTFIQEIYRVGSDEILNSANITWVNTNQKSMKSATIPNDIRTKLNKYLID